LWAEGGGEGVKTASPPREEVFFEGSPTNRKGDKKQKKKRGPQRKKQTKGKKGRDRKKQRWAGGVQRGLPYHTKPGDTKAEQGKKRVPNRKTHNRGRVAT